MLRSPSAVQYSLVHDQLREDEISLVEDRVVGLVTDRLVHQRVRPDKVEHEVGQRGRVVDAGAGSRFRDFRIEDGQPGRV